MTTISTIGYRLKGRRHGSRRKGNGKRDHRSSLNIFDSSAATKASLCPVIPAQDDEWHEAELTTDTGACDTVVPRLRCPSIPIMPSPQSKQGMKSEFATGQPIPNSREKRCDMWTAGASQPKTIKMQVAALHKALLSPSRCAVIGFESRFGVMMGFLSYTTTNEVIPSQRSGNLYTSQAWIRAAPFGRPEVQR